MSLALLHLAVKDRPQEVKSAISQILEVVFFTFIYFATEINVFLLSVLKVLSGSSRAGRLRRTRKYIDHRLVIRPEPDNTFGTASTISPKVIVRF